MPRNKAFHSHFYEPLRGHSSLELQHDRITGPFSFLNPTRASFKHISPEKTRLDCSKGSLDRVNDELVSEEIAPRQKDEQLASDIEFKWRSRDNRKGRHALVVDPSSDPSCNYLVPKETTGARSVLQGVLRMATQYPYWDVSWLVAVIFTLGSVVWVINAFFSYLPLAQPGTEFHNEILVGGGVSAFIGATIFEIGSVLLIIEAMNDNKSGCFGWALERVLAGDEKGGDKIRVRPDNDRCVHHQTNKGNFVGKGSITERPEIDVVSSLDSLTSGMKDGVDESNPGQSFVWWPSVHELQTHYLRELGFLAAFAQLCGASIFWVSLLSRAIDCVFLLIRIRSPASLPFQVSIIRCLKVYLTVSFGYHRLSVVVVSSYRVCFICWRRSRNGIFPHGRCLDGILVFGI